MLYRHEKPCFRRKQTRFEPSLPTTILHIQCTPFIWVASTTQMYSWLCVPNLKLSIPFVAFTCFMFVSSNKFIKPCFHELTMEYSIFGKIHLSRVFPLFISTVGMKILKEEFNLSWCNIYNFSRKKIMASLWIPLKTILTPSLFSYIGISGSRFL
jgi:hypothetical protein